jgi:type 2 lantibiotic biosynthesis protein LanM
LRSAGFDLYGGAAGIGLFLAYLGAVTGEARYTAVARAAAETIPALLADSQERGVTTTIGAFSGLGGLVYLDSHLGALWGEPALLDRAEALAGEIAARVADDASFDIIDGAAGAILGLLSLYRVRPTPAVLAAAVRAGDHLIAKATASGDGIGWVVPGLASVPLTGFSHGAAGIALALVALAAASGEWRFRSAGMAALAYERGLRRPTAPYWPDLRGVAASADDAKPQKPMHAWCHGAPGIGLARLGGLDYHDDSTTRREIWLAATLTRRDGFGLSHSLCHGDLGNLDFLAEAARRFPALGLGEEVARRTAMTLESGERDGWSSGLPLGVETPDLMLGLAGVGYGLLRLAAPARVPSVLRLAAPADGR